MYEFGLFGKLIYQYQGLKAHISFPGLSNKPAYELLPCPFFIEHWVTQCSLAFSHPHKKLSSGPHFMWIGFLRSQSTKLQGLAFKFPFAACFLGLQLAFCLSHFLSILEAQWYSVIWKFFNGFSKAQLWTPQLVLWLFGKPNTPSCYLNLYFGLWSLFTELKLPLQKAARVFGTEVYWDLLISLLQAYLPIPVH